MSEERPSGLHIIRGLGEFLAERDSHIVGRTHLAHDPAHSFDCAGRCGGCERAGHNRLDGQIQIAEVARPGGRAIALDRQDCSNALGCAGQCDAALAKDDALVRESEGQWFKRTRGAQKPEIRVAKPGGEAEKFTGLHSEPSCSMAGESGFEGAHNLLKRGGSAVEPGPHLVPAASCNCPAGQETGALLERLRPDDDGDDRPSFHQTGAGQMILPAPVDFGPETRRGAVGAWPRDRHRNSVDVPCNVIASGVDHGRESLAQALDDLVLGKLSIDPVDRE